VTVHVRDRQLDFVNSGVLRHDQPLILNDRVAYSV
jgi:hypothetical protein